MFYNTLGTTFVPLALQAARAADPNTKLYINDYNIEGPGAKATAMLNLVKTLQSQNVPIDGVGFQCHFIVGELPSGFQQNLEAFTALGIEVAITELDIRMTLPSTPALLAQQKTDYNTVISACEAVEKCIGITIWDWTDKYSWVPSTFSGQGAACPWDEVITSSWSYDVAVLIELNNRISSGSRRMTALLLACRRRSMNSLLSSTKCRARVGYCNLPSTLHCPLEHGLLINHAVRALWVERHSER